jgi:iron(III) transport system substrate-binding protein
MRTGLPVLLLLALAAVATAAEVVVYSPHGEAILTEFSEAFEAAHPGVDVRTFDMGANDVLERLRAERKSPRAHVWWGAPATSFTLAGREGLLESYRPTWAAEVGDYARGEGDLWYGQFDLPIAFGYVPDRFSESELPRGWDDLVRDDPPWRLLLRNPPPSGTMRTWLAAMILRAPTVDAGFEWLKRLAEKTAGYPATPELLYQKLSRGEGDLTVWNVTDLLFQADKGYPFAVHIPADGVPVITDGIALVAGATDEARAFYEFVTSIDANLRLAEAHFRFPTRRDLPPDRLPAWRRELDFTPMPLDRERVVAEEGGWIARWDREVRDAGFPVTAAVWLGLFAVAVLGFVVWRRRQRARERV